MLDIQEKLLEMLAEKKPNIHHFLYHLLHHDFRSLLALSSVKIKRINYSGTDSENLGR